MAATITKKGPGPYDAIIQDLKNQRAKLDAAIAALEALRDTGAPAPVPATRAEEKMVLADNGSNNLFRAMSIPDAAIKLLGLRDRPMKNPEIAQELKAGGLIMNSADPVNTIGSVLTRRFNERGDIVKIGRGMWALKEWRQRGSKAPKAKAESGDGGDDSAANDLL